MKKLMSLCFLLVFSCSFYAQEAASKKKTTKPKTEETAKKEKITKEKVKKAEPKKKEVKAIKEPSAKASDNKKGTKTNVSKKPGKDYKTGKGAQTKDKLQITTTKKLAPKVKEINEKAPKKADKVSGQYNGKKVYTGPKGGKYYINSKGNKTYIQE